MGMPTWEADQRRAALGQPEMPGILARIGRGFVDVGQPLRQAYYNAQIWNPQRAADYRQQRDQEEQLYLKGVAPNMPAQLRPMAVDPFRAFGRFAAMAPLIAPGGWAQLAQGANAAFNAETVLKPIYNSPGLLAYLAQQPGAWSALQNYAASIPAGE